MNGPTYTLADIAEKVGGRVVGDPATQITGVAPLRQARPGDISFLASSKQQFRDDLAAGSPGAILLGDESLARGIPAIVVDKPRETFDEILALFPTRTSPPEGIHSAAQIDPSAELAPDVVVGPGAVIQSGVRIGPRTVIWPNVFVGCDSRIGEDCTLHPGVVIREQTQIGDRVIIHPNAVLGADGFGYRQVGGKHVKVPQVGRVIVGNDVEIGACAAIDRAKCGATTIGNGVKIDNHCQIAHNVQIGDHALLMAQCGIAGSAIIEHHAMLAGKVGVADNLKVGAGTIVTAAANILGDASGERQVLGGWFAQDHRDNLRQLVNLRRLGELIEKVDKLAERLGSIEQSDDNQ